LELAPEEPEARPWRAVPLTVLVRALTQRGPGSIGSGRPVILAIDGRSNNGKTSLAVRIAEAVPGAAVIHTDDIAWGTLASAGPTCLLTGSWSPCTAAAWMAEEIPFNAAQRAWERADVIVCGTPEIPCDPITEIVVAPPLAG
jgi:hypothetical protein